LPGVGGGGGGTITGELATKRAFPGVGGGGGGTITGEEATSLAFPGVGGGGGGTITGLKWPPLCVPGEEGGCWGTITDELAAANPELATAPTARIAERKRVLFEIIWSRSPCGKANSEIVPQKLYNFYNKSNFF
jgi:hypothetical protein